MVPVGILTCLVACLLTSCGPTIGYWRFLARGQNYYIRVANGCDELLSQHEKDLPFKIAGNKMGSLPIVLRELDPSFVIVDTNCVSLLVGGGFDCYHLIWRPEQEDGTLWQLRVFREGPQNRVVFTRRKAAREENVPR
ncbi:hypothetical protein SBV1_2030018 [Verrucomicrobia bacterium]|nr:hypothetical protein SBV1_2030018 [Verrucomicrobiota bacterium]